MSTTTAEPSLEIFELVDLDLEPGCEHHRHPEGLGGHQGPAAYLVRRDYRCACAGRAPMYMLMCASGYAKPTHIRCIHCNEIRPKAHFWTIVSVL